MKFIVQICIFQFDFVLHKWNLRNAKVNASTIQEKSNDVIAIKVYVDTTEKWNEQVDDFESVLGTDVEPERKNRLIKFFRALFKTATPKDAEDILVSCKIYL